MNVTQLFKDFFESEKSSGLILICCTALSLILANSGAADNYIHLWHAHLGSESVEYWINDGLMAIFFLLVGLEVKREFSDGRLASWQDRRLPMIAAMSCPNCTKPDVSGRVTHKPLAVESKITDTFKEKRRLRMASAQEKKVMKRFRFMLFLFSALIILSLPQFYVHKEWFLSGFMGESN